MNLCRACRQDFGSTSAFDAHRVGKHSYTYSEGVRMEPLREDGRRCLTRAELETAGWTQDGRGRWRQPLKTGSLSFTHARRAA